MNPKDHLSHTPLYLATKREGIGSIGAIILLVEKEANITIQNIEGRTALHKACRLGLMDIGKLLL